MFQLPTISPQDEEKNKHADNAVPTWTNLNKLLARTPQEMVGACSLLAPYDDCVVTLIVCLDGCGFGVFSVFDSLCMHCLWPFMYWLCV